MAALIGEGGRKTMKALETIEVSQGNTRQGRAAPLADRVVAGTQPHQAYITEFKEIVEDAQEEPDVAYANTERPAAGTAHLPTPTCAGTRTGKHLTPQ